MLVLNCNIEIKKKDYVIHSLNVAVKDNIGISTFSFRNAEIITPTSG